MAVKLKKGESVQLKNYAPNLNWILIVFRWNSVNSLLDHSYIEIEESAICIDQNGRCESVVFYNNDTHSSGAIKHDNKQYTKDGYIEQIEIILNEVPENITRFLITINIYDAYWRRQDLSRLKNCSVCVIDFESDKELLSYDVKGNFNGKTGIFIADIYRNNGEWEFKIIGEGVKVKDINEMVELKFK